MVVFRSSSESLSLARSQAANPNAIILAEHYGNPEGWLKGDEWDTVMNYDAFMEPLTWFLTGMEKHSDEYREDLLGNSEAFIGAMKTHMRALHMSALQHLCHIRWNQFILGHHVRLHPDTHTIVTTHNHHIYEDEYPVEDVEQ